ncbi:hypothetical protein LTR53_007558 [Teratosphaeriaceae sp. CCFEE 6253]|nr:hypothetical protein LTR53_007558 [Teratosphaeriaceae sp. CCFEE 6253]
MALSFQKRKSLRDILDRIDVLDDASAMHERYILLDELGEDVAKSSDFRWHAPSTQNQQDFHLDMYRTFVLKWLKGYKDEDVRQMSEDQTTALLFPDDTKALGNQLNFFIVHDFKRSVPKARAAKTILVRSLIPYRGSLMFWCGRHFDKRNVQWSRRKIFNDMSKAMRYVQKMYGGPPSRVSKTWLGLAELRQLLDFEAFNNRCVELSEQHQALWCMGRVTALRPGSLCPTGKYGRTDPFVWRDLVFTVGDEPGMFEARLTITRLDIKHAADPLDEVNMASDVLAIRFISPEAHNLIFSSAHRLLLIALRRGLLKDIVTIDELLGYTGHVISIKPAHLDDLLFFAGRPKGDSLDHRKPLSAASLTAYLRLRGKQVGSSAPITWYSIRRRAATDMSVRIGLQATRVFLGHTPDSQTLEKHYLNVADTLDHMGVLLDQDIEPGGQSTKQRANWAPLVLGQLNNEQLRRTRGNALAQMTRRLILADPDPPTDLSARSLKNYRRNARRIAEQQLLAVESEKQRTTLSKADVDAKLAGLRAARFADEVLQRALQVAEDQGIGNAFTGGLDQPLEDGEDHDGSLFVDTDDVDDGQAEAEPEEDLERRLHLDIPRDEEGAIIVTMDDDDRAMDLENSRRTPVQDASYVQQARSMMELLMDNTLSEYVTWKYGTDKRCPICQEDDTVSDERRMKEHNLKAHLDSHLNGNFHHPVSRWKRRTERDCRRDNGTFYCPYCEMAELPYPKGYKRLQDLIVHIMESRLVSTNDKHDELKAADGWYDEEFAQANFLPASQESIVKHMARGAKNLAKVGIDMTPERLLLVPEHYGPSESMVRGSYADASLPARYAPFVQAGWTGGEGDPVPPHLTGLIGMGLRMTPTNPLPDYLRDVVTVGDGPRSQESAYEDEDTEMVG